MRAVLVPVGLVATLVGVAPAEPGPREWYAGAHLRSDGGVHRVRVSGGARRGALAATIVLDPKAYLDAKENDTDGVLEWMFVPEAWSAFAGWRFSQLSIDRGTQYQHAALLGLLGELPRPISWRVRARFGIEFEATVLRHGSGLERDFISFASERHVRDLVSVNFLLRFELVSPW